MESFAAVKLQEFEQGRISRRRLIETLVAAATATTATAAQAAEQPATKVVAVNHISYTNPDYHKAADWYSKVFNLEQVNDDGHNVNLPFGKMGEHPYGITANDVGTDLPDLPYARTDRHHRHDRDSAPESHLRGRSHGLHGRGFRPRSREGGPDGAWASRRCATAGCSACTWSIRLVTTCRSAGWRITPSATGDSHQPSP